jgi:tRNA threonylcarbamoyladenosine biosynthesis protein TsaE
MPESRTPEQTEQIAAELAQTLRAGDVVLVSGDLGAGKTTFVRGACRALGVDGPVTSPTFTIARRYEGGRVPVSHLDLYRLEGSAGEDPALLEEEIGTDRVTFVEWPEIGADTLADARVTARVLLEHRGPELRAITIERIA